MCGRFINLTKTSSLKKKFDIVSPQTKDLRSYNISPSQTSNIIFKKNIINIDESKWGYSFFDKKNNQEKNIINSRIETINNKVLFKESYYKRKCIIPLNGYYEWSLIDNNKIPFFIHIPPCEPMYLAGIWKYINFKKDDQKVFTIITKNANENISKIHHRMPALFSVEEGKEYLDDDNSFFLNDNFSSSLESELDFYPVSKFVNNPLNNSKECIQPAN
jgi:putative SOS response-associated peptidase YedK